MVLDDRPHFYQEEKLLIPLMPPLHPLSKRLKEDHEGIRELILSLGRDVERHDLTRLANQIDVHIRFEEREFFQYLEEHLSAQQLSEVYVQLEQHPVACKEEWEDQFWVNK